MNKDINEKTYFGHSESKILENFRLSSNQVKVGEDQRIDPNKSALQQLSEGSKKLLAQNFDLMRRIYTEL